MLPWHDKNNHGLHVRAAKFRLFWAQNCFAFCNVSAYVFVYCRRTMFSLSVTK